VDTNGIQERKILSRVLVVKDTIGGLRRKNQMIQKTNKVKIWNTWKGMCRGEIFVFLSLIFAVALMGLLVYDDPSVWRYFCYIFMWAIIYTRYLTMYIDRRKNKYDTKDKGR